LVVVAEDSVQVRTEITISKKWPSFERSKLLFSESTIKALSRDKSVTGKLQVGVVFDLVTYLM
jgi:hypothetical protein